MADGDIARLYHRLTACGGEGWDWDVKVDDPLVLQDFVANDLETWPAACKAYPDGLPVVALPREWEQHEGLDLAALARILYLSVGVVRFVEREDRPTLLLRAAGSAGGRFPYELYVAARDGVHWYDPVGHALVQVGPPPDDGATTLILTGVPWRTGWRYCERGLRHIYWDAGTVLAQTLGLADGLEPRLYTRFPDEQVTRLVGAEAPTNSRWRSSRSARASLRSSRVALRRPARSTLASRWSSRLSRWPSTPATRTSSACRGRRRRRLRTTSTR